MEVKMNFIKQHLKIIIIIIVFISFLGGISLKYYLNIKAKDFTNNDNKEEVTLKAKDNNNEKKDNKAKKVFVDIKGAIKNPGVYEIENTAKVIDVVTQAGGLTEEADTTYVNLARKVSDEMVVVIYTKDQIKEAKKKQTLSFTNEETCICPVLENDACLTENNSNTTSNNKSTTKTTTDTKSKTTTSSTTTNSKVNINTANLVELQTLSGVGESKAQAIIDYRDKNGKFEKIEDILNVSGIGDSIYEKIKDNITI
jgi:competence protein ComEA